MRQKRNQKGPPGDRTALTAFGSPDGKSGDNEDEPERTDAQRGGAGMLHEGGGGEHRTDTYQRRSESPSAVSASAGGSVQRGQSAGGWWRNQVYCRLA